MMAQLVNFLQVPVQTHPSPPVALPLHAHNLHPLPPPTTDSSSAPSMQQLAINAFDEKYGDTREDRSPAAVFHHTSLLDSGVDFHPWDSAFPGNYTILAEWAAAEDPASLTSYDDDFLQLGFRPQYEITTEL